MHIIFILDPLGQVYAIWAKLTQIQSSFLFKQKNIIYKNLEILVDTQGWWLQHLVLSRADIVSMRKSKTGSVG